MTKRLAALLGLALALLAAACGGGGGDEASSSDALVWGVSAGPVALDPALAPDLESRRVQAQIFEGLVGLKPGTTELAPALATAWTASPEGRAWTFELRKDVTFQDGTPLTASAVCANFDRWHGFKGSLRSLNASYYWQRVFGGFEGQPGLYKACVESGPTRVVIELTEPSSSFLAALAMPAFGIASPKALVTYNADAGTVDPEKGFLPAGTFATEHPVGTGPFKLQTWSRGDRLVLTRNDDYWGEKAKLKTVVYRLIPAEADRLAALQRNEIQGYDLVSPENVEVVEQDPHLALLDRPAFDVGYLTINIGKPPMEKLKIRQAIAYGLDRRALADSFPGGRAEVATQFVPPVLSGYSEQVTRYDYDPAKAKRLLRQAGVKGRLQLEFWYPVDVSRPYMPEPTRTFSILASSLEKAGFEIRAHSAEWSGDYLRRVDQGKAGDVNLVGWTGDYADAANFLGTFFSQPAPQWGFRDDVLHKLIRKAGTEPDQDKRADLYAQANERVMTWLPGVPLVYTREAVALRSSVQGYISSPLSLESLAGVFLTE